MAANTFQEMARSLRLYVPDLPIVLAEQFIRDRYRRILERKDWAGLRNEADFTLDDEKDGGTVTATRASATVTGSGTNFLSTDVTRQFKVSTDSPIYTITAVASTTSMTIDRVYAPETASSTTYKIFDGYISPPSNFRRFISVTDPQQGWRLRHWIQQQELQSWDPQRNFFGQPYVLADRKYDVVNSRPQYELWPYNQSARALHYYYYEEGTDLTAAANTPIYPIRSDAIVTGALADLCRWPPREGIPNPMFGNMEVFISFEREYEDKMNEIERKDEEIYLTWYAQTEFSTLPFAPLGTNFIQAHAI